MKKILSSSLLVAALAAGCDQNSDQSNRTTPTNQPSGYATNSALTNNPPMRDSSQSSLRERTETNVSAMDQGNSDADIKATASIRKAIVSGTNSFSMAAQNIQIITRNGNVTLRGSVPTDAEKSQIGDIAKGVAGNGMVENDLEVKTNQ